MSVLNQSGEEQQECPLCMEPLEVDDLNFYPCTCGYQICRFCWHRIRTDENGLCPACRKAYSENPADFIPLSQEQVAKLKADKRQRDQQRKAKLSESRKHLASVRVVQRNLVFVVGLPVRLADAEILRRHEYFGKFGKIHKVVINQSTSYAGSQGPSASAYVTYMKSDDALRAIQNVNNITIDGRQIKSSLGTTKYCSHFMKNQPCPKPDCMYLHDFGDPEASFTKEQMHAGKHQEYEKKLHDQLTAKAAVTQNNNNAALNGANTTVNVAADKEKDAKVAGNGTSSKGSTKEITSTAGSGGTTQQTTGSNNSSTNNNNNTNNTSNGTNKENWPQLNVEKEKKDKEKSSKKSKTKSTEKSKEKKDVICNVKNLVDSKLETNNIIEDKLEVNMSKSPSSEDSDNGSTSPELSQTPPQQIQHLQHLHNLQQQIQQQSAPQQLTQQNLQQHTSNNLQQQLPMLLQQHMHNAHAQQQQLNKLHQHQRHLLDDNSSFFSSSNSFAKLVETPDRLNDEDDNLDGDEISSPHQHHDILTDSLPNINTTEDWAAAFGFPRQQAAQQQPAQQQRLPHHLQMQQEHLLLLGGEDKRAGDKLDGFGGNGGFGVDQLQPDGNGFGKSFIDIAYNDFLVDMLNKTNCFGGGGGSSFKQQEPPQQPPPQLNGGGGMNGLDQNLSKFFMDFHKNSAAAAAQQQQQQKESSAFAPLNGLQNNYYQAEKIMLLQQKQIEEQFLNISINNKAFGSPTSAYQNGGLGHYLNGDVAPPHPAQQAQGGSGAANAQHNFGMPPHLYGHKPSHNSQQINREDELDFDPIQETQKAFAEMMANEQQPPQLKTQQARGAPNGGYLPPPPPGFVQPGNTHMNSFGSKILPFLNMSNNSSQIPNSSTQQQNGWPSNFNSPPHQQMPQHKNVSNACNDWKVLDPAILTSSRHFPLAANMPQQQQHSHLYNGAQQQQQQQNGNRNFDFNNTAFSNFASQLQTQPSYSNNYSHISQPNLNWFGGEINTSISSPPGFRNQATKQQEC
ncbi:unnamed protein product [Brassicogethes aeneus]|uniref:CCR4-NOT transcription complex subunit 4 n=1 Tax=Brassicogethes aeneus TaxID=1431903 RepID=A0A9P0FB91_BRAAE|nr:unnamed protein product [Brassicogethes aeneus]